MECLLSTHGGAVSTLLEQVFGLQRISDFVGKSALIHPCLQFDDGETLSNIDVSIDGAPKCDLDFFMLCFTRSISGTILQSGSNLRAENPDMRVPSAFLGQDAVPPDDASSSGAGALPTVQQRCKLAILSRGDVPPGLKVFERGHIAAMTPVLYLPTDAVPSVTACFETAGVTRPSIVCPEHVHTWTVDEVLRDLRSEIGRVSVECGPTVTRPMYTRMPPSCASVAHWVNTGEAVHAKECPVDLLALTTYTGQGMPVHAIGEPLVRWAVLHSLFETVGRVHCQQDTQRGGTWTFRFMRKRPADH